MKHRWVMVVAAGAMACAIVGAAHADPPAIAQLRYSADIGANLIDASTYVARRDFVLDDLNGTRVREPIPGLPDTVILRDFHIEANNNVLFALDVGTDLDGTYYDPADVIRYSGSFSKAFDAAAAGVPRGVHCDGIARLGDTDTLLLSFDRTFAVGGITIRPADVIEFSAGGLGQKLLDARARGLSDTLNVDAIDTFRTKDYLLLSFDSGGAIGGTTFNDEDVLQLNLRDGSWSKRFALGAFSDRWDAANLDGVAAVNNDTIFQDDYE